MVRNSILIFCLCVRFCQCHISVSLCTHLYTHIINKLLHGWCTSDIVCLWLTRRWAPKYMTNVACTFVYLLIFMFNMADIYIFYGQNFLDPVYSYIHIYTHILFHKHANLEFSHDQLHKKCQSVRCFYL